MNLKAEVMTTVQHHGARLVDSTTTVFSLWAPDARTVDVELADGAIHPLERRAEGWYSARVPCGARTGYRFVIDGALRVPDPASRAQCRDAHGESRVVDHRAYRWRNTTWQGRPWHESIIYELHAGLLNGFDGVASYLNYFKKLGATAIELMPVGEFPGKRNWGYDVALPFAPDASYGSPDDLKALIDAAHSHGLMVYIDVVYNHFSPDGNYLGHYASSFFRDDIHTPWGAAIDFRRPEVRQFFIENALMWINDYRVDGLRFDAVHAIDDKDFLKELATAVRASVAPQRHVHLVVENEDNSASLLDAQFDAQWNDDGHNVLHHLLTGESEGYYGEFADGATEKLARCLKEGFVYQGKATRRSPCRGEPSAHLPATAFVLFLQNHDQIGNRAFGERLINLTDHNRLSAAVALLLLSPMVPLLFMGEELGSRRPFLYFTDHDEALARRVTEGRRQEFSRFSHFSDAARLAEIPDPNARQTFQRCYPYAVFHDGTDYQLWLDLYVHLLALRQQRIMPYLSEVSSTSATVLGEGAVAASWSLAQQRVLRIALNLGATTVASPPLPAEHGSLLFTSRADAYTGTLLPGSIMVWLGEPADSLRQETPAPLVEPLRRI